MKTQNTQTIKDWEIIDSLETIRYHLRKDQEGLKVYIQELKNKIRARMNEDKTQ